MPYIKQEFRKHFENMFRSLYDSGRINNPGELNYIFTVIINHYIVGNGLKYQSINDVIGALEGAKLEFYREVVGPYENEKKLENGPV